MGQISALSVAFTIMEVSGWVHGLVTVSIPPDFIRQVRELHSAGADSAKCACITARLNKDTPAILGRHLQVKNIMHGDLS